MGGVNARLRVVLSDMSREDDEKVFEHESYAMVGFSRITGSPGRLFGSSIANHHSFIRLSVRRAKRIHHLGRDWYHGAAGADLIEVDLSPAQFAELLTGMNVGSGVPCTLRYHGDERMADPPDELLEAEQVKSDFKGKTEEVAKRLDATRKKLEEVLAKKNVTQQDRNAIRDHVGSIMQEVRSNLPFWLDQFHEATEKVVTAAKAEVDAFMAHAIATAGMKALQSKPPSPPAPALPAGEEQGTGGRYSCCGKPAWVDGKPGPHEGGSVTECAKQGK